MLWFLLIVRAALLAVLWFTAPAFAQGPPSCEDQRDFFRHGKGMAEAEAAQLDSRLRAITRERDDLKAKLADATKKPDPKAEEKK